MSYCKLITFKNQVQSGGVEFRNAWGGSARIWDALFKAYITPKHDYDSWMSGGSVDNRLWDLITNPRLEHFEKAVHAFTFDLFYVRSENFKQMASDLRLFAARHPAGACVDHLPAWANVLDAQAEVKAIALYGTSVGENLWIRAKTCKHCGHQTDDVENVRLSEGREVYDYLKTLKPKAERMVVEGEV